uniref:Probable ATP-dependent RNA helicase A (inferred by orthology to a C. elegans protein) n=1 Tax=Strongyloides venezuelensis TaxID=75913 RepID=A0A0K0FT02_STRVS
MLQNRRALFENIVKNLKNQKDDDSNIVVDVEDDPTLYLDLKCSYNWLGIKLTEYELTKNKLLAENFVEIKKPTGFNIDKEMKYRTCTVDNTMSDIMSYMENWYPPSSIYDCWKCSQVFDLRFEGMEMSEISRILQDVESKKNKNEGMEKSRRKLPVYEKKMRSSNPTGSGKSTQVAQILLKHYITQGRGGKFNCIITQPRRLSAISLAKRVAQERYEKLGDSVGYCVRFDKVDPRPFGSILFETVGTILRKLSSGFRGVSHIIVDEVHERSLETDFLLIFLKKMLFTGCKIKIILMSATVETHEFENFFEKIKVLEIEGRSYNINETYLDEIIQHFEIIPTLREIYTKKILLS